MRTLLLGLALCLLAAPALAQDPYIVGLQNQVDRFRLMQSIHWLENIGDPNPGNGIAEGTRFVDSELARSGYIVNALRDSMMSYGWDVGLEAFTIVQDTLGTVPCWNVIARRDGVSADGSIIIGAHWDSINWNAASGSWVNPQAPAPAADDNGSGVSSLLEIGRILGHAVFSQNVEICFFGGEEEWMLGSQYHVAQLEGAGVNIAGYLNVDMVGYDANTWDLKLFYDPQSAWFKNFVVNAIHLYSDVNVTAEQVGSSWSNSDLFYFWQADPPNPAVGFWEGDDHAPLWDNCCDTVANNYVVDSGLFLTEMCRIALACFCERAYIRPGTPADPLPGTGLALSAWPNPFAAGDGGSLRLALSTAASEVARVDIYDIGGRQLRSLKLDGTGEARWDGRDEQGEALPAGLYLARTAGLPAEATQRIVLLR